MLERRPFERPIQTTELGEMKALVRSLDGRHLVIQGPPGSGKTWTSGRLIADLIARGQTVGVASTSHKAIHNLLDAVEAGAAELGLEFRGLKKASGGNPESFYASAHVASVTSSGECVDCELAAGTAWLFSNEQHDGTLDYLFIDEAGQVSLADALAMGTAARNLVLVGDPLQLDQVLQGTHPSGSDASVLKHLLGEHATVPADRGLFLERTFRLHPDVCGYISEEFYEGRLEPAEVARERTTPLGTGLRYLPVSHEGRRQESGEEVAVVRAEVERLAAAGVPADEIMVVAAYNAQVNALRAALPEAVRVGTVDKFQGQEATVVLYSLASSSGEDVPRGLEFLLSRNRLERGDLAGALPRLPGLLAAAPRGERALDPADAARECALPPRRARWGVIATHLARRRCTLVAGASVECGHGARGVDDEGTEAAGTTANRQAVGRAGGGAVRASGRAVSGDARGRVGADRAAEAGDGAPCAAPR